MYRVSVQPLFEKSMFKPEDSEIIVDREYGNVSIFNNDINDIVSATKDIIKKLDETILKYKIILNNFNIDNNTLEEKVDSVLQEFIDLYKDIRFDYTEYLNLKNDCNNLLTVIEENNEENIETYNNKKFDVFSNLQKRYYELYLNNIKHLNDHQNFMRIKLFDSIIDIETLKILLAPRVKPVDALGMEHTSTEMNVLKTNVISIYEGGSSNTPLIDNDLTDNIDDSKVYPEYELRENGNSSYEKDVGEIVYLHEICKNILNTSLKFKYKELNKNFEKIKEDINNKVDSKLIDDYINSFKLKFFYDNSHNFSNNLQKIITEYHNSNGPFTRTVNNGNNNYEITDIEILIKNIDIKF